VDERGAASIVVGVMHDIGQANPFVDSVPSHANAISIFKGEWASRFPAPFNELAGTGTAPLFEDPRVYWAKDRLSALGHEISGASILELGPLEAGHTYMLSQLGAREITAVEANARAYLKCLVAKEVLRINHATFLLGDAVQYLRQVDRQFDVGVVCAFLNHMINPVEVIQLLSTCCRALYVWNVAYDESLFEKQPEMRPTFGPATRFVHAGYEHELFPHTYGRGFDIKTFWGGMAGSCCWMRPDELARALRHFGYVKQEVLVEDHLYGKCFAAAVAKE
jgi:hypothetical protein